MNGWVNVWANGCMDGFRDDEKLTRHLDRWRDERVRGTKDGQLDGCRRGMGGGSVYTQGRHREDKRKAGGKGRVHPQTQPFPDPPTFKVHSSISIEVHIADNLLDVSVSHLMTQQLPHGLS